jgi:hypothetical protein
MEYKCLLLCSQEPAVQVRVTTLTTLRMEQLNDTVKLILQEVGAGQSHGWKVITDSSPIYQSY